MPTTDVAEVVAKGRRLAIDCFVIGNTDCPIVCMSDAFVALIEGLYLEAAAKPTRIFVLNKDVAVAGVLQLIRGMPHVLTPTEIYEVISRGGSILRVCGATLHFFVKDGAQVIKIGATWKCARSGQTGWNLDAVRMSSATGLLMSGQKIVLGWPEPIAQR